MNRLRRKMEKSSSSEINLHYLQNSLKPLNYQEARMTYIWTHIYIYIWFIYV